MKQSLTQVHIPTMAPALLVILLLSVIAAPPLRAKSKHISPDGHSMETNNPGLLYENNLRGPNPSMVHREGECQLSFVDGGYLVSARSRSCQSDIAPDVFFWDLGYAVSARVVSASNGYGIGWGEMDLSDNSGRIFFLLRVTPDRKFSIIKHLGTQETYLVQPTPSSAINTTSGAINELAVVLHNGSIDALINGHHVASVGSGEKLNGGKMLVFADHPDTRVIFSNARVTGLPTPGGSSPGVPARPSAKAIPQPRTDASKEGARTHSEGGSQNWNPYDSGDRH